jgi:hypothetical protein
MGDSVLLAVTPGTRERLRAAFAGHELVCVEHLDQVRAELAHRHFDLVVIGARFEESTAFDALRLVIAASPAPRVVCLRGVSPRSLLGKSSVDAFRIACEALGACLVLDLQDFPDDEAGNRAMRSLLEHELELCA